MSAPVILALMSFCFLFFGYLGVPVPFSLIAGVFVGAALTDVSLAAIVQKIFDGVDSEALLAIPFAGALVALFTVEQLVNGIRNGFDHPEPPEIDRDIPAIDTSIPTRPGL